MNPAPFAAVLLLQFLGGVDAPVVTRDCLIASQDPGILLSVRSKSTEGEIRRDGSSEVVLLVHGATLSSRPAFDPDRHDASWADWMARRGYAVYLVDIRNYGGSTREKAMNEPPDRNPAPSRAHEAVRDIGAVVDHLRARHGVSQVNLVGWSWGGTTAGFFASLHPEKVRRLVLYAPIYSGREEPEPYRASGAYGYVSATAPGLKKAWDASAPVPDGTPPRDDGIVELVAAAIRTSDPTSGTRDPATSRFPKGCLEDLHLARIGRPLWSASSITSGTLVIVGDHDPVAPVEHAEALMRDLTHAPSPKLIVLKGATHFAQFEAGRSKLFEEVDAFLRDANRGSQTPGR